MKDLKKILKFHLFHLLGLILYIGIIFYNHEDGDMKTVIFGIVLYIPYALLLTVYNLLTITLFRNIMKENKWTIYGYLIPLLPLIIWYIYDNFSIKVRYWTLEKYEFWTLIFLLGLLNTILYLFMKRQTARP